MPNYVVQDGDCMSSIAQAHGFQPKTLWNLSENSALRDQRKDMNVLMAGDEVFIPELRLKQVDCADKKKHKFKRLGVPAHLRLRLLKDEDDKTDASSSSSDASVFDPTPPQRNVSQKPRANVPYRLEIDGHSKSGSTDGDGRIDEPIPPDAESGVLILNPGTAGEERFPLQLGSVAPLDEAEGVRRRLNNLGFPCEGDADSAEFRAALMNFQEAYGLEVNGHLDQATRDKLKDAHGC